MMEAAFSIISFEVASDRSNLQAIFSLVLPGRRLQIIILFPQQPSIDFTVNNEPFLSVFHELFIFKAKTKSLF